MINYMIEAEIECKSKMVDYFRENKMCKVLPDIDVIDISGAVLASNAWRNYCNELELSDAVWRIALLRSNSYGAKVRANESTVWNGSVEMLNQRISERSERIIKLGDELGVDVQIKYYENVPVTRYMRLNQCFIESYYPSDCTGANTPLYVLKEGTVLQKRVKKEFDILWNVIS